MTAQQTSTSDAFFPEWSVCVLLERLRPPPPVAALSFLFLAITEVHDCAAFVFGSYVSAALDVYMWVKCGKATDLVFLIVWSQPLFFVSAFALFVKSPFSPRVKPELMTLWVFLCLFWAFLSFFFFFFCLIVICLHRSRGQDWVLKKKRDIQHQEDIKVVLQMCVTQQFTTPWLLDRGHIIIANILETVPFPWLSENINSKKCTWKTKWTSRALSE